MKKINVCVVGGVDHGKSTLLGRLFTDLNLVSKDYKKEMLADPASENLEYSFYTDGLKDERSRKITMEVAHKYFKYNEVEYILADTPGHMEYLPQIVSALTRSDIVVLILDVNQGITSDFILRLNLLSHLQIQNVIICLNKLDCFISPDIQFDKYDKDIKTLSMSMHFERFIILPTSGLNGNNLINKSDVFHWYTGNSLLEEIHGISSSLLQRVDKHTSYPCNILIQNIYREQSIVYVQGVVLGTNLRHGVPLYYENDERPLEISHIYKGFQQRDIVYSGDSVTLCIQKNIALNIGGYLSESKDNYLKLTQVLLAVFCVSSQIITQAEIYTVQHNYKEVKVRVSNISQDYSKADDRFIHVLIDIIDSKDYFLCSLIDQGLNNFILMDSKNILIGLGYFQLD